MNQQSLNHNKKKIAIAVTNDLVTDNRVHKIASTLVQMGFKVTLIGRLLPYSQNLDFRAYNTHRMRLWFNKGPLFYANYNISLWWYMLTNKFNIILSNDLDSLLGSYVTSKMKKLPLVYDSHEYFTEVPELVNRPFIQKRWEGIEEAIVPKLKHCYTVCQSIANVYNTKYGTNFKVVRNVPFKKTKTESNESFTPPFPIDKPVILYQGAVNIGRGIEEAIVAMHQINHARLVIIGHGDEFDQCQLLIEKEGLKEKVVMTGRIPFEELRKITPFATIGLSVEKDIGLNYRYALPNKLFDYIQHGVPILASSLPEIKGVVEKHQVGSTIELTTSEHIANGINTMLANQQQLAKFKQNCEKASELLCWENEEKVVQEIFKPLQ